MKTERKLKTITRDDFEKVFGNSPSQLTSRFVQKAEQLDFEYFELLGEDRDQAILATVQRLLEAPLSVSGSQRQGQWEKGWKENLDAYLASKGDPAALIPYYYKTGNNRIMRFQGQYIRPVSTTFETDFLEVMRIWLADSYLSAYENVYEFGCGPGHNIYAFHDLLPKSKLFGLDWVSSSQDVLATMAKYRDSNRIFGKRFDFFEPDHSFKIAPNSAVLTLGALEQIGTKWNLFLDYLMQNRPAICLNIEPIVELYDPKNLLDYLALKYSQKRGYLNGYLEKLRQLQSERKIEILDTRKLMGSQFHDGWTLIAWKIL